jgi:hypothetical protein
VLGQHLVERRQVVGVDHPAQDPRIEERAGLPAEHRGHRPGQVVPVDTGGGLLEQHHLGLRQRDVVRRTGPLERRRVLSLELGGRERSALLGSGTRLGCGAGQFFGTAAGPSTHVVDPSLHDRRSVVT